MPATRSLSARARRAALAAPFVAASIFAGCGSSDDAPDTTNDVSTTVATDDGAGTELQPGSNQPPDETPSIGSLDDTMTEGTPGPNDEGVPDAGSMPSVVD